ncbi:MAG TPA: YsnF/AvaK domain-containing protein [Ktedonobacterales bacterium]|nr:YsnF/AvaK domain-containing protein [Ktedonobacterales bacterium]
MLDNTSAPEPGRKAGRRFIKGAPAFDAAGEKAGTTPNVDQRGAHTTPARDGDTTVPVHEEELIARKTPRNEAGRVPAHTDIVEETQSINVPVTREEVTVERVPARGAGQPVGPDAFQEQDIEVPVMGEEVMTEKRARVGDEIHIHKQQVTEQQRFSGTARNERAHIEGQDQRGSVPLTGSEEARPPADS